jgi:hypothetical protein
MFLSIVRVTKTPAAEAIKSILPQATDLHEQLMTARKSGQRCRKQAIWIGVERCVL